MKKIISFNELGILKKKYESKNKKIVLCHGTFDLIHVGHIKHFASAKKYADILVVSITSDKFVLKGPGRPIFNEKNRAMLLSSFDMIDHVVINDNETSINLINNLKPNFYCKGPDYKNHKDDITGNIKKEIAAINKNKGKIIYTNDETFSSTKLINFNNLNNENVTSNNFQKLKNKINIKEILNKIEKLKKLKVLVVGEIIIDEYNFFESVGKSGKETNLVVHETYKEKYLGGIGAIANHVSSFVKKVKIISYIGSKDNNLSFIKSKLSFNISSNFIKKDNSPTILKKRYIDEVNNNKILGVYKMNDSDLNQRNEKEFIKKLTKDIKNYDLVILADYGHGLINSKISKLICKESKYLAVNSQNNASNFGFQNLQKFSNFNLLILNEGELRLNFRDRGTSLEKLSRKLIKNLKVAKTIVTSGKNGAMIINNTNNNLASKSRAFASKVIDKVGSGDAMLAIASLCDKVKMSDAEILYVSSLAAAQKLGSMGNKTKLNKLDLIKSIYYMLK